MDGINQKHEPAPEKIPTPAPPDPNRLGQLIQQPPAVFLLLVLLVSAIYSNTFSFSFHFDDASNIVENPLIKNLRYLLIWPGSRYVGFLSFALNYHFGHLNVFGYHLVNLIIHIVNACLVYAFIRLLLQTPRLRLHPPLAPAAPAIALTAALLFAVHPIQTQAVTYIVQRFASLAALFYLLTVVCYLQWRLSPPDTKRRYVWYAGALIATILAMKTKENTFTLPFMLLLVEVIGFGTPVRKQWIGLIPFFLTLPIIPLSRPGALGEGEAGLARSTMDISRLDYLFTQFRVIVTYLRLLIFPVHQNLDYDYPLYHSLLQPPVFLSALLLAALLGLALLALRRATRSPYPAQWRLIALGILWFFLTLSIESSIIPIKDLIYEHRLYLPSVGFWLAASTIFWGFYFRGQGLKFVGLGIVLSLLVLGTYHRNRVWQDEVSLWADVARKSPHKPRGYNNLGKAYQEQGASSKAVEAYEKAIQLEPGYAEAHNNLGNAYKELGRLHEAVLEYKTAFTLKPDLAEAHNDLGLVYSDQGLLDEAVQEFQTALRLKPNYAQAHNNFGNVQAKLGDTEKAVHEYATALSLNPDYADPYYNLGNIYRNIGRLDRAIQSYQQAIKRNPQYALAHNNLGLGYFVQGRLSEALIELKEAVRIKPDYFEAHNNLGVIYKEMGHPQEAVQEF